MAKTEPRAVLNELTRLEGLRDPNNCRGNRQFKRFVVRTEAELVQMDRNRLDQSPIPIHLRDIGRGGIGFVCAIPLEVNSNWRISFVQRGYVVAHQAMVVRHGRQVADNLYLIGGQFCAETGLLCLLGVDPRVLREGDGPTAIADSASFLAPGDVA